jgi:phosphoribosylformylglycinamidine synthase PurS subunit
MTGSRHECLDTLPGMAAYEVHVEVSHRPGIADPAGATVERALPALGYTNVTQVHIGKVIRLVVVAADAGAARAQAEEMCERLLANPVIESYEVTVAALETTA